MICQYLWFTISTSGQYESAREVIMLKSLCDTKHHCISLHVLLYVLLDIHVCSAVVAGARGISICTLQMKCTGEEDNLHACAVGGKNSYIGAKFCPDGAATLRCSKCETDNGS